MMAEQIAHRDAVGRNGVVEAEFRDVIADRLLPIQANDFVIEQIMK